MDHSTVDIKKGRKFFQGDHYLAALFYQENVVIFALKCYILSYDYNNNLGGGCSDCIVAYRVVQWTGPRAESSAGGVIGHRCSAEAPL